MCVCVPQAPPERANGASSFMKTQWTNWQPQNQISVLEPSNAMGYFQVSQLICICFLIDFNLVPAVTILIT